MLIKKVSRDKLCISYPHYDISRHELPLLFRELSCIWKGSSSIKKRAATYCSSCHQLTGKDRSFA